MKSSMVIKFGDEVNAMDFFNALAKNPKTVRKLIEDLKLKNVQNKIMKKRM